MKPPTPQDLEQEHEYQTEESTTDEGVLRGGMSRSPIGLKLSLWSSCSKTPSSIARQNQTSKTRTARRWSLRRRRGRWFHP